MMQISMGYYTGLNTQQGSLVANNHMDLLSITFMKIKPLRDGKDVLVLTDAFSNFS